MNDWHAGGLSTIAKLWNVLLVNVQIFTVMICHLKSKTHILYQPLPLYIPYDWYAVFNAG